MHFPLISIIGPTSTGKSQLALALAKKLLAAQKCSGVDIISADSRQVYSNFPLLSGADLDVFFPHGFSRSTSPISPYPYFSSPNQSICLHGVGIIDFRSPWSLGLFYQLAAPIITHALAHHRAVIIVGGTLLYHERLFGHHHSIFAPPCPALRAQLAALSVARLQQLLSLKAPALFAMLNNSDQHNPRRLIRHLEILHWQTTHPQKKTDTALINAWSTLHKYIVPAFDVNSLRPKIRSRVAERFRSGAIAEVAAALAIINSSPHFSSPSASTPTPPSLTSLPLPLGFSEIAAFLNHELNEQQTLDLWELHEWQYAKRQLTYLKKLAD